MKFFELMKTASKDAGLEFTEVQYEQFIKYMRLLQEWNEKINLTAITEDEDVIKKHFIDCIKAFKSEPIKNAKTIIDVGTGAGFPGLPIAIINPNVEVTLLDSLNKRINFLQEVANELNLQGIEFIHGRAEDFGKNEEYREKFDVATARAVAGLPILMEFCVPFVKVGGYFICLKGPNANLELEESKVAMEVLGIEFVEKIDIKLPDLELNHNILVFKKIKNTPSKYPRKAGKPSKNPIK